jgi:enoyl-[acyl-carrier protein] reductase II
MKNILCDMLGIKYPILLGGMLFVGRARLVSAVSEAGGLGVLGAGAMGPETLREEIRQIRSLTDQPFGINIPLRSPLAEVLVQLAIQESVRVVATSAGNPSLFTGLLKEKGITVIHVVPTVAHALQAQEAGVDAVVAEGSESGGYINLEEVTTMALVPQVVDAVSLPVIAAGGIADARGLVAAFALGAVGIQMGTRFLASEESDIPNDYKRAILLATDTDTIVVREERAAHRDLKRELIERVSGPEVDTLPVKEVMSLLEKGTLKEVPKWIVSSAGESAGLVREILAVERLIHLMLTGAREIMAALPGRLP